MRASACFESCRWQKQRQQQEKEEAKKAATCKPRPKSWARSGRPGLQPRKTHSSPKSSRRRLLQWSVEWAGTDSAALDSLSAPMGLRRAEHDLGGQDKQFAARRVLQFIKLFW